MPLTRPRLEHIGFGRVWITKTGIKDALVEMRIVAIHGLAGGDGGEGERIGTYAYYGTILLVHGKVGDVMVSLEETDVETRKEGSDVCHYRRRMNVCRHPDDGLVD